uniref:Uncharacterized protein n=1 Tax=Kalanchoe fedtschenkoi TaxID=63787 RepID=A0A7N0T1P8_KALFE
MPKLDVQATQSPAVQIMERPGEDASPYRIPDYVFDRTKSTAPVEWSSASNESLFSIQMGHMSFTGDLFLYNKSEDLGTHNKPGEVGRHDKSGEIGTHHNKELGASNKSGEFGSYSSSGELGYSKSVDLGWYNLSGELATPGQMKPGSGQITNSSGRPQPQANASGNVGTNNSFFSQDFHRGEPPRLGPGVGASEAVAAETMKEIIRENEQKHNHMKNPSLENGCSSPSTVCHLDQRTSSTKSFAFPVLAEEDKSPSSSKHSSIRASSQQPHPPQQPQTPPPAAPANSTSTVASTQPRRSFFSCFSCCPIRIQ